ncbi:flagellar protein FlaG [Alkaliphilus metalliredigens]|nr:flagellar protein FlaG [Alkaliphilus metalliredigens]
MKIEGVNQQHHFSGQLNTNRQGSQQRAAIAVEEIQSRQKNPMDETKSKQKNVMDETQFRENPMKKEVDQERLMPIIDQANKSFEAFDRRFEFSFHEKTNAIMIKVIDRNNDEVIREIPPEKLVNMMANMLEVAGLLIDERA